MAVHVTEMHTDVRPADPPEPSGSVAQAGPRAGRPRMRSGESRTAHRVAVPAYGRGGFR
jgi:hypothetical protein